jgi:hypothetical protein
MTAALVMNAARCASTWVSHSLWPLTRETAIMNAPLGVWLPMTISSP